MTLIKREFDITQVVTPFVGSTVRHGTESGWGEHQKRGEGPCVPCWLAKQAADHRRHEATPTKIKNRKHASAQQAAYGRLRRAHPEEYRQLYEEEKKKRGL